MSMHGAASGYEEKEKKDVKNPEDLFKIARVVVCTCTHAMTVGRRRKVLLQRSRK